VNTVFAFIGTIPPVTFAIGFLAVNAIS